MTISSESLQRLLSAVVDVGSGLDLSSTLQRVIEAAVELSGARFGALGVLDPTGTRLDDFITTGLTEAERDRIGPLPSGHGILGLLIQGEEVIRLDDLTEHPAAAGFPRHHPKMGSFLGVPVRCGSQAFGNLYLTEKRGGGTFTEADAELVVGLAAAAGVAIENARLHQKVRRLVLVDERERLGRDLHDTVIQRLFAVGLSLQTARAMCDGGAPDVETRIEAAIDDIDDTVKHIRTVIFGLESTVRRSSRTRDLVLEVCDRASVALGFRPGVAFNGAVDSLIPEEVASELLATLGEALSNVARHAHASAVDVIVSASSKVVELTVRDNGGGGVVSREGGKGLLNMGNRAERLGGRCEIDDTRGGTTLLWKVPLSQD